MGKQAIEAKRARLNAGFGELVEAALKVEEEMKGVPHERGIARRSLKPQSGMHIVHEANGFSANCEYKGQVYEVRVYRR
jgi:hypothetical protein